MVVAVAMESSVGIVQQTKTPTKPISIPQAEKRDHSFNDGGSPPQKAAQNHVMRFLNEEHQLHKDNQESKASESPQSDEDFLRIPDGSPCFVSVMEELRIDIPEKMHQDETTVPISPLVLSDQDTHSSSDAGEHTADTKAMAYSLSPILVRKRVNSASTTTSSTQRARSYSWNYRSKMGAERRSKHVSLVLPKASELPSSTHSSPLVLRKPNKSKNNQRKPKVVHLIPKYKFLTENISVSHEDIVKEQERERYLAEGFAEVKSIFHSPIFDRLDGTPE